MMMISNSASQDVPKTISNYEWKEFVICQMNILSNRFR